MKLNLCNGGNKSKSLSGFRGEEELLSFPSTVTSPSLLLLSLLEPFGTNLQQAKISSLSFEFGDGPTVERKIM